MQRSGRAVPEIARQHPRRAQHRAAPVELDHVHACGQVLHHRKVVEQHQVDAVGRQPPLEVVQQVRHRAFGSAAFHRVDEEGQGGDAPGFAGGACGPGGGGGRVGGHIGHGRALLRWREGVAAPGCAGGRARGLPARLQPVRGRRRGHMLRRQGQMAVRAAQAHHAEHRQDPVDRVVQDQERGDPVADQREGGDAGGEQGGLAGEVAEIGGERRQEDRHVEQREDQQANHPEIGDEVEIAVMGVADIDPGEDQQPLSDQTPAGAKAAAERHVALHRHQRAEPDVGAPGQRRILAQEAQHDGHHDLREQVDRHQRGQRHRHDHGAAHRRERPQRGEDAHQKRHRHGQEGGLSRGRAGDAEIAHQQAEADRAAPAPAYRVGDPEDQHAKRHHASEIVLVVVKAAPRADMRVGIAKLGQRRVGADRGHRDGGRDVGQHDEDGGAGQQREQAAVVEALEQPERKAGGAEQAEDAPRRQRRVHRPEHRGDDEGNGDQRRPDQACGARDGAPSQQHVEPREQPERQPDGLHLGRGGCADRGQQHHHGAGKEEQAKHRDEPRREIAAPGRNAGIALGGALERRRAWAHPGGARCIGRGDHAITSATKRSAMLWMV